jgi:hypothetical protein
MCFSSGVILSQFAVICLDLRLAFFGIRSVDQVEPATFEEA